MAKQIGILGSTGSIGTNGLRVIEALGADYEVFALTGHNNIGLLAEQVKRYKPKFVAVTNEPRVDEFRELVKGLDVTVLTGQDALIEIAELEAIDTVLTAVVGAAGLGAVLAAAKKGKRLAIANKEPLVVAGPLLMEAAKLSGAEIIPVDSEHSAIFQAMQAGHHGEVDRIILTTSGGPFRGMNKAQIEKVGLEEALSHPTWDMGPKITVDSATMMNKALEVIEARWLFDMPLERIEVLVHPESIVHSLVEFVDGSVVAQLGTPDMCLPIQYALTYPNRAPGIGERLRLEELGALHFEKPDTETFTALKLGYLVAKRGGTAPAVFNAANEAAVEEFLESRIKFSYIVELIESCLEKHNFIESPTLPQLMEADSWARTEVKNQIEAASHRSAAAKK
jgi:1-deoxy-D-xylulose-5-phosphate reductoisomerase